MIEYKIYKLRKIQKTEEELNILSREGWRVACSFGKKGKFLLLKRKRKPL